MVRKPDFSKEREEYFKVRADIRRCCLFTLAAMAVVLLITKYFTLPKFLNLIIGILSIVLFLVMIASVFLLWYQNYRFKRLVEGRELWYFWARIGDGIYYFFVAMTRRIRAERRAKDKAYETSVQTASKIDRIVHSVSNVEVDITAQMREKNEIIHKLNEDKSRLTAELEYMTAKYTAEADNMVAKTAELNLKIQEATIRYESLKQENEDLQVQAEAVKACRGRKQTKGIESLFVNSMAFQKMDSILSFLRIIQEQDKHLTDGYCKRLALYFCALRHLGYITDNITVYAKYFYPHSGKDNVESYIKTFNNQKVAMQESDLLTSAISEMQNLVESSGLLSKVIF